MKSKPARARGIDWEAVIERLELIIDCLTNCQVAETIKMDRGVAERAVRYCRGRAAGEKANTDAEQEIIEFCASHNQSLDWVFAGDAAGMVCDLARGTSSIRPPALRLVT
jgi:hypothetical protein